MGRRRDSAAPCVRETPVSVDIFFVDDLACFHTGVQGIDVASQYIRRERAKNLGWDDRRRIDGAPTCHTPLKVRFIVDS